MSEINTKSLFNIGYGIYLITTKSNGKDNGMIGNSVLQISSNPLKIAVSINNQNYSKEIIDQTKILNINILDESAPFSLIENYGFTSGREVDKCKDQSNFIRSDNGLLVLTKCLNSFMSLEVESSKDYGSHTLFICNVTESKCINRNPTMSYQYYQKNVKPKTNPVVADKVTSKTIWVCTVCGQIYEGEEVPKDYICPICKHDASNFEKVQNDAIKVENTQNNNKNKGEKGMKWVCPVCGYVHEGDVPPEKCPVCKIPGEKFGKVEGEMKLAAEHKFGIYDATVKNNPNISDADKAYILEQLKANFAGECSEVGMYLCMARIAHREGYPEVGLYWEKAAFEEAEHAAKFAELLGSECEPKMTASTKANLAWRVDCEFGATQGKFDLALCAKKNGLDEIHDTVHEMARDEARHGKALQGLLERYFNK